MIKVMKFGGTSMGSATNMRKVASIVGQQSAKMVVLSAMSGTTDALLKLSSLASSSQEPQQSEEVLSMLREKYTTCITELLSEKRAEALEFMERSGAIIRQEMSNYRSKLSERLMLAQGELVTSAIFAMHLQEAGVDAQLLFAPEFVFTDEEGKVNAPELRARLHPKVMGNSTLFVTQGFICTNNLGESDNLGRGGSDYSAALMGAAIDAHQVQIWTDIDGMHNNDPRYVENTYPIRTMNFDEAAELAYFGAKILHPSTIQPCKDQGIAVLLKNTLDPSAPGTTISDEDSNGKVFHAVAAKDGITVIRIYSARMLMAYGFLRKVFEIFEAYRTPIDMITTSEVAVSLTIDNDTHLEEIVRDLESLGSIEIERENSIVCIVGNMDHTDTGLASQIFSGLNEIPIKMISYGASHRSITLLIGTKFKKQTLQRLNDTLF